MLHYFLIKSVSINVTNVNRFHLFLLRWNWWGCLDVENWSFSGCVSASLKLSTALCLRWMWSISERSDRPGRAHEVQSYQLSSEQDRAFNIHPVPDMYSVSVIRLRQPVQTMDVSHCLNRRVLDDSRLMLMRMSKPCWLVNCLNLKTISFMQTSCDRVIMLLRSRTSPPATYPGDGTLNSAVSETVKGSLLMV